MSSILSKSRSENEKVTKNFLRNSDQSPSYGYDAVWRQDHACTAHSSKETDFEKLAQLRLPFLLLEVGGEGRSCWLLIQTSSSLWQTTATLTLILGGGGWRRPFLPKWDKISNNNKYTLVWPRTLNSGKSDMMNLKRRLSLRVIPLVSINFYFH